MARSGTIVVENNFTRGLITEFTAMNFPENAVTDTDNCVYSELGAVSRRNGIDYEDNHFVHKTADLILPGLANVYTEFTWHSVGNVGSTMLIVQQIGSMLRFFSPTNGASVSWGLKSFSVDLSSFVVGGRSSTEISRVACQFTSGSGYLFVTHPFCQPIYISYDNDTDNITATAIPIEVRDMSGVDDGLEIDTRPTTLSDLHKYNLWNQGWYGLATVAEDSNTQRNPLEYWDQKRDDFPSNADIWWVYKNTEERLSMARINQTALGNTPAPRGHYIYDAFYIDRTGKTGITGLPYKYSSYRPSSCVWYAGRIWYAGVQSSKYSSTLYFSQIIEGEEQFGRCYQQNDPTSEHFFDLLDTDGGTIELPLIGTVIAMKAVGDALVIIGTNAIYAISGSDTGPFRASNYTVRYISPIGGISHLSIIEAEGALIWWNYDGIYSLTPDQTGSSFEVTNISKQTIAGFLADIPTSNKLFVKGVYNKRQQIARWIFNSGDTLGDYQYDRALDFNLASKAFYPHTFDTTSSPRISGLFTILGVTYETAEETVFDGLGVPVTDGVGNTVTISQAISVGSQEVFKFLTTGDIFTGGLPGLTYSELRDLDHLDWKTHTTTGVSFSSYGESGYRIRGEMLRAFNSTPVSFVVKYSPSGSCKVSGIWDYGFRQSSLHELYLVRPEVDYLIRRIKIRGKGKSLQLRFESAGNAPFILVGWSTFDTGGTQP